MANDQNCRNKHIFIADKTFHFAAMHRENSKMSQNPLRNDCSTRNL